MKYLVLLLFICQTLSGQTDRQRLKSVISALDPAWSFADIDIQSDYYDDILKLHHYYFLEEKNGLAVYPEVMSIHLDVKGNPVYQHIHAPTSLVLDKKADQSIAQEVLIGRYLALKGIGSRVIADPTEHRKEWRVASYTVDHLPGSRIQAEDCYYESVGRLERAVRLYTENLEPGQCTLAYLSAANGKLLYEKDLDLHCGLETVPLRHDNYLELVPSNTLPFSNSCYRVYPVPIESPYHGSRKLEFSPWLKASNASPLGWHSDGQYNYYSSEGNNVDAYEDMDGDNQPTGGDLARAYGGAALNFDFNYDTTNSPPLNKNASITNLFYWTNIMHDVWYQYGFNESAGNFQYNNFNKGGLDLDNVIAEGLDNINTSRNNANFSCPPDGYPGRLQMYVWQVPTWDTVQIESPVSLRLAAVHSAVSPSLLAPLSGDVVQVNDGSGYPLQGCNPYINGPQINGKIALLDRGICNLNTKITMAQNAGAMAMIICNVDDNPPSVMGGISSGVGIPVINISRTDGNLLKSYLGQQLKVTLWPSSAYKFQAGGKKFLFSRAAFGAKIPTSLNATLTSVIDQGGNIHDACNPIINNLAGQIALIEDGNCEVSYKAYQAQLAGAVAVVIGMNTSGYPYVLPAGSYGSLVSIPVICVAQADYQYLLNITPLSARLSNTIPQLIDADFDAGIVSHEYAHGISIRLTGGPNNNACLINAEQAGEGWSDYFALAMTMKQTDLAYQNRGIGTWPSAQGNSGVGIRPTPYNVDMSVDPATYGMLTDQIKISQPHGIGYVWCSMIWDMTWAMIKRYGFESDIYNSGSTAGNIKSFQLVMAGLKIQPCGPGFVDSRNAILKADTLLYNGANACLLWNIFARRGLGYSANQGSPNSRDDGIQAFDLPPFCSKMSETELFGSSTLDLDEILLDASAVNEGIQLNWSVFLTNRTERTVIKRWDESGSEIKIELKQGNSTSYLDQNVKAGETYHYQVLGYDDIGEWHKSNKATVGFGHQGEWQLSPNPAHDEILIFNRDLNNESVDIQLFDALQHPLSSSRFFIRTGDKIKINTSELAVGQYIILISDAAGVTVRLFVKI